MTGRLVVVGRNSTIWRHLSRRPDLADTVALGHRDIAGFDFHATDRVWIFSYSREDADNLSLMRTLHSRGVRHAIYVSTATANVVEVTQCYGYPSAKHRAESTARQILGADIVRIGLVHETEDALPGGTNAATSYDRLAEAMTGEAPPLNLFTLVPKPFPSKTQERAYRVYGGLMRLAGSRPCLLRPVDLALRMAGCRWYGYLYLSNRKYAEDSTLRL